MNSPQEILKTPNRHPVRYGIALAAAVISPLLLGPVLADFMDVPHGGYSGIGVVMAFPFLLFIYAFAFGIVGTTVGLLALWAKPSGLKVVYLFGTVVCVHTLVFLFLLSGVT